MCHDSKKFGSIVNVNVDQFFETFCIFLHENFFCPLPFPIFDTYDTKNVRKLLRTDSMMTFYHPVGCKLIKSFSNFLFQFGSISSAGAKQNSKNLKVKPNKILISFLVYCLTMYLLFSFCLNNLEYYDNKPRG